MMETMRRLVHTALGLTLGALPAQAWQDDPFSGDEDWEKRGVEATWGDDAPGDEVVPRALLPIEGAPYSRPDAMQFPVSAASLVIGIAVGGEARAYPVSMLGGPQREIINDRLGAEPFAVNW